jgi:hypothetical protein
VIEPIEPYEGPGMGWGEVAAWCVTAAIIGFYIWSVTRWS